MANIGTQSDLNLLQFIKSPSQSHSTKENAASKNNAELMIHFNELVDPMQISEEKGQILNEKADTKSEKNENYATREKLKEKDPQNKNNIILAPVQHTEAAKVVLLNNNKQETSNVQKFEQINPLEVNETEINFNQDQVKIEVLAKPVELEKPIAETAIFAKESQIFRSELSKLDNSDKNNNDFQLTQNQSELSAETTNINADNQSEVQNVGAEEFKGVMEKTTPSSDGKAEVKKGLVESSQKLTTAESNNNIRVQDINKTISNFSEFQRFQNPQSNVKNPEVVTQINQVSEKSAISSFNKMAQVLPPKRIQTFMQVAPALQKMINDGESHLLVQLEPQEWGKIDIRMDMKEQSIIATFMVQDQDTLQAISQHRKDIERILKENSFDVKPDSINFVVKNNVFDKSTSKIEKEMESYSNAFSSTNILC